MYCRYRIDVPKCASNETVSNLISEFAGKKRNGKLRTRNIWTNLNFFDWSNRKSIIPLEKKDLERLLSISSLLSTPNFNFRLCQAGVCTEIAELCISMPLGICIKRFLPRRCQGPKRSGPECDIYRPKPYRTDRFMPTYDSDFFGFFYPADKFQTNI